MTRYFSRFAFLVSALLGLSAPACAAPRPAIVLAAASLQESMNAAADAWARQHHPRPRVSFAGSSALARQIEAGAPADLFISADEAWMDYLAKARAINPASRTDLLTNSLVLIAPVSSRISLRAAPGFPLARALGPGGRLAVADTGAVPAGRYAKEALTRLGVWNSVSGKLAPGENVRAALAFVSRGECPLGVVYATDARADPSVRIVSTFPAASHKPITYPLALTASSRNPEGAAFRRFLLSAQGKAIFRRFGFGTR